MRICIPTRDDRGLEAEVQGHLGNAAWFTIVDISTGEVTVHPNEDRVHARGSCDPGTRLRACNADAVVCEDIGERAYRSLQKNGIQVLRSRDRSVRRILADARWGLLRSMAEGEACMGTTSSLHQRHATSAEEAPGWFG